MALKKQQRNTFYLFGIKVFSLLFFVFLPLFSFGQYITSTNFRIENPTIVVGGGSSSSLNFQYIGSTGEFVIGESEGVSFTEQAGFLYFPFEASVAPPAPTPGGGGGSVVPREEEVFPYVPGELCKLSDFNCDGRVNILDLSILLYYQDKTGAIIEPYDLSGDGAIGLADVSIMFYYWDF